MSCEVLVVKSFFPTHSSLPFPQYSSYLSLVSFIRAFHLLLPVGCCIWIPPMGLGTSLARVSLHSNNREWGLISWLVFQAGRHLGPAAAQPLVDLLSSLSKLYACRHFPKPHAVQQMSDLSYLLPPPGIVSVASGLAFPVPFSMAYFGFSIISAVSEHCPSATKFVLGWLTANCFTRVLFLTVPGASRSLDSSQRLKPHYCKPSGLKPWLPLDLHKWADPQESLV